MLIEKPVLEDKDAIGVYCVGIHFRQKIRFKADLSADPKNPTAPLTFMKGVSILKQCAEEFGLRYKLTEKPPSAVPGHINYVAYTPTRKQDPDPRVTFPLDPPLATKADFFPFYGQPLSLTEILAPLGQPSQVLQYGVQSLDPTKPTPALLVSTGKDNDGRSQFGENGFPPGIEIRIRSLNIFCTY